MSLKRHMAASPPERSLDASAIYGSRTTRKHPFQFQKRNSAGENKKIIQRVFLVGRAGVTRPQASGLSLRFSNYARNGFELRHKIEPDCATEFVTVFCDRQQIERFASVIESGQYR